MAPAPRRPIPDRALCVWHPRGVWDPLSLWGPGTVGSRQGRAVLLESFDMTKFRPCIDLHEGIVKQIVGGSLRDQGPGPTENFVATQSSSWFASKYRADGLTGGHVIKLGPGNDDAARKALSAYPGGLQIVAESAPTTPWPGSMQVPAM